MRIRGKQGRNIVVAHRTDPHGTAGGDDLRASKLKRAGGGSSKGWVTYGVEQLREPFEIITMPGYNPVSATTGATVTVWQSRTRFKPTDPWHTYSGEHSRLIEQAYQAGGKSVELTFKGKRFIVDTNPSVMRQSRADQPTTYREIRRSDEADMQWYSARLTAPYTCTEFTDGRLALRIQRYLWGVLYDRSWY